MSFQVRFLNLHLLPIGPHTLSHPPPSAVDSSSFGNWLRGDAGSSARVGCLQRGECAVGREGVGWRAWWTCETVEEVQFVVPFSLISTLHRIG